MVYKQSGFKQISGSANMSTEYVSFDNDLVIPEAGFIYCFVSFENTTGRVFWDDFKVTHVEHPVIQTDDYYPFGLAHGNGYQRGTAKENKYLFGGKELQTDLDLGWLDFHARQYDPIIGRMTSIDPLSEMTPDWTPYRFGFNNPIRYSDPTGMSEVDENGNITYKDPEEIRNVLAGLKKADGSSEGDRGEATEEENRGMSADISSGEQPNGGCPSGAICDSNGGMFFSDRTKGYNYMWDNSRRYVDGKIDPSGHLENRADIVEGGLIVHPTEGYEFNRDGQTERYRKNSAISSNLNLLPYTFDAHGNRQTIFNDQAYSILAGIHTHPGATSVHLSDNDLDNIGRVYPASFTISTRGIGAAYSSSGPGSLEWLLSGGSLPLKNK